MRGKEIPPKPRSEFLTSFIEDPELEAAVESSAIKLCGRYGSSGLTVGRGVVPPHGKNKKINPG
jgi:hypothetical protein